MNFILLDIAKDDKFFIIAIICVTVRQAQY